MFTLLLPILKYDLIKYKKNNYKANNNKLIPFF